MELIKRRFSGVKTKELPDLIINDGGRTHLKKVLLALEDCNIQFQKALGENLTLILFISLMVKV